VKWRASAIFATKAYIKEDGEKIKIKYCKDPQMTCTHGSWNMTDLFTLNNWRIFASKAWRISLHKR
jgi:hypothetical protein